jgi:hypothetical protein
MSPPPALAVRWNYHGFDVAPRQEAAMSLYAAIDLHSSNSVLAVMDGDGTPVLRAGPPNPTRQLVCSTRRAFSRPAGK